MIMNRLDYVRNFCIVAHIDHGKSTLADRLIEVTNTVAKRDMSAQLLDSMDIEQERGITIKLAPTTMKYNYKGHDYTLNLIDTPGHVDFSYEVSRSLLACEGAIVLVDATQGVQAQTLANVYLALDANLEIVPVINKIDLASADVEGCREEIENVIGLDASDAPAISAKNGINIEAVLQQVIEKVPAPKGDINAPLKALIFDSYYDSYKGAVSMVRVVDGQVKVGDKILFMSSGKTFDVTEVGIFTPRPVEKDILQTGDVGYICGSIKTVCDTRVGDTITSATNPTQHALPGFKQAVSVVFCGIFPLDGDKYADLKDALEKLKLNDASINYVPETSGALGSGFRVGFLGLLHMEIITERLEREFNLDIITTAPSVEYKVIDKSGQELMISNPTMLPSPTSIERMEEPMVKMEIITPSEYIGNVMDIAQDRRGEFKDMQYLDTKRAKLTYIMPLNEIVFDFFDKIKSSSKGYASIDYTFDSYKPSELTKVDILLNGEKCDALSFISHKDKAYGRGKAMCEKLKDVIPRQMFEIPIQAVIGAKVIARETVKALRKDVLAKCYGGDITRKRKLLEKQKEGKKRMRRLGSVDLPSEAFISILKLD
ncbi:MAG: translation elongation factor 4 [Clostridia bacterium]|nr:translation elongation factor 4 [Clostridia bacterium]